MKAISKPIATIVLLSLMVLLAVVARQQTRTSDVGPAENRPTSQAKAAVDQPKVAAEPASDDAWTLPKNSQRRLDATTFEVRPLDSEHVALPDDDSDAFIEHLAVENTYGYHDYLAARLGEQTLDAEHDAQLSRELSEFVGPLVDLESMTTNIQCNNMVCLLDTYGSSTDVMRLAVKLSDNRDLLSEINRVHSMEKIGDSFYRFYFVSSSLDPSDIRAFFPQ
ncbi:MAG: hypothetical protein AAFY44_16035 [Pseudomonadota bacterium]